MIGKPVRTSYPCTPCCCVIKRRRNPHFERATGVRFKAKQDANPSNAKTLLGGLHECMVGRTFHILLRLPRMSTDRVGSCNCPRRLEANLSSHRCSCTLAFLRSAQRLFPYCLLQPFDAPRTFPFRLGQPQSHRTFFSSSWHINRNSSDSFHLKRTTGMRLNELLKLLSPL